MASPNPTPGQRPIYDALVDVAGPIFLIHLEELLRERGYNLSRSKVMKNLVRLKKRGLVESYPASMMTTPEIVDYCYRHGYVEVKTRVTPVEGGRWWVIRWLTP